MSDDGIQVFCRVFTNNSSSGVYVDTDIATLTVEAAPVGPVWDTIPDKVTDEDSPEFTYNLNPYVTGRDGPVFGWSANVGTFPDQDGVLHIPNETAVHNITVTASDNSGESSSDPFEWNVTEVAAGKVFWNGGDSGVAYGTETERGFESYAGEPWFVDFELYMSAIHQTGNQWYCLTNGGGRTSNYQWVIEVLTRGRIRVLTPALVALTTADDTLRAGDWMHIVVGWDGTDYYCDVDGSRQEQPGGYSGLPDYQQYRVFHPTFVANNVDMYIRNVTISEGGGANVVLYPLDEGEGTVVFDQGEGGFDGTILPDDGAWVDAPDS